jgi:hypothetical protein
LAAPSSGPRCLLMRRGPLPPPAVLGRADTHPSSAACTHREVTPGRKAEAARTRRAATSVTRGGAADPVSDTVTVHPGSPTTFYSPSSTTSWVRPPTVMLRPRPRSRARYHYRSSMARPRHGGQCRRNPDRYSHLPPVRLLVLRRLGSSPLAGRPACAALAPSVRVPRDCSSPHPPRYSPRMHIALNLRYLEQVPHVPAATGVPAVTAGGRR